MISQNCGGRKREGEGRSLVAVSQSNSSNQSEVALETIESVKVGGILIRKETPQISPNRDKQRASNHNLVVSVVTAIHLWHPRNYGDKTKRNDLENDVNLENNANTSPVCD